jgi:hypothetical protein
MSLTFNEHEMSILKELTTPKKIQDFLNTLKINFEEKEETCWSPRQMLKNKKAHCIEGAIFAAAALRFHGHKPLIVDMEATNDDEDHVMAVFKLHNHWGAIHKTNHAVLRYREPVYKSIRELVMSHFHEYFLNSNGKKTLRAFSRPVDLSIFDKYNWMTSEEDVWFIPEHLTEIPHTKILNRKQIASLRRAEPIEIQAGSIIEYKNPRKNQL